MRLATGGVPPVSDEGGRGQKDNNCARGLLSAARGSEIQWKISDLGISSDRCLVFQRTRSSEQFLLRLHLKLQRDSEITKICARSFAQKPKTIDSSKFVIHCHCLRRAESVKLSVNKMIVDSKNNQTNRVKRKVKFNLTLDLKSYESGCSDASSCSSTEDNFSSSDKNFTNLYAPHELIPTTPGGKPQVMTTPTLASD